MTVTPTSSLKTIAQMGHQAKPAELAAMIAYLGKMIADRTDHDLFALDVTCTPFLEKFMATANDLDHQQQMPEVAILILLPHFVQALQYSDSTSELLAKS